MPTGERIDPLPSIKFNLEIDGIAVAGFSEVSGIGAEVTVVEYRSGNDKAPGSRKLPGEAHFSNVVLKRGMTSDLSLWDWMQQILDGTVNRKTVSIVLFSDAGEEVLRFNLRDAWPVKWTGPTLNGAGTDVAIETLEIAHEGLTIVS